jgi:DNA-binding MarR family transcriptional regulator
MKQGGALDYGILDNLLGYSLRLAQNALYLHFSQAASDPDITPQRFAVLVLIERNPGIGQSTLSEAMGINRSGAMRLVDWFETRDFVQRVNDTGDARRWGLKLTTHGRKTLAAMTEAVRTHDARLVALLDGDGAALKRLLDRLAEVANKDLASAPRVADE